MTHQYSITGMTCENCIEKITEALKRNSEISSVEVSLSTGQLTLEMKANVSLEELNKSIEHLKKYKIAEYIAVVTQNIFKQKFKTYYPLILIFGMTFLVPLLVLLMQRKDLTSWMPLAMGSTLVVISFFKFLDIAKFAEGFSTYDPLAKLIPSYGYVYPFVELGTGVLFLSGLVLQEAAMATIFFLGVTTLGVLQALRQKRTIQCACLGTIFNLPLTIITVIENTVMIAMSLMILL